VAVGVAHRSPPKAGTRTRSARAARLFLAVLALAFAFAAPTTAFAANAIRTPTGYATNLVTRGDDTSNLVVNLPFAMNWNGTSYTQIYLNMNGNATFGNTFTDWNPAPTLASLGRDIMAPFWADVDTRNTATGQMSFSNITPGSVPTVDGHNAILVNWIGVARYNSQTTPPADSFQLVIIDRSDTGAGNFDFEFNYNTINWDFPTASSTGYARAGWARTGGVGYELPGGNTSGRLLDTGANAVINGSLSSGGVLGRYVWQVRNGVPPNSPPIVALAFTTKDIEGNAYNGGNPGLTGYTGAGDATASDPDGSVASFTRAPVAGTFLPLGSNVVTWTARDNSGATTVATQTIVVRDTTAPTNGAITSSTHTAGVWSGVANATVNWAAAVDACTGVDGYSYEWSQGAVATPDTVREPAGLTSSRTLTDGTWYFNLRSVDHASNWPPNTDNWSGATSFGPILVDTLPPTTTDSVPPSGNLDSPFTITLTATDAGSGVATTRYRVDGAAVWQTGTVFTVTPGIHTIEYYSTDNRGRVETTHSRLITADDFSGPVNGTITSPTHPIPPGTWSSLTNASVQWTRSIDAYSGLDGYSWSWSLGATATPAAVKQPNVATSVHTETFPTATWSAGWTTTAWVQLTNQAGPPARSHGSYAAEIYANSGTQRTANFYRDYDLTNMATATLVFESQVSQLTHTASYARVGYTAGAGDLWNLNGTSAATGWVQRTYPLTVGGVVRIYFSGRVNAAAEYVDFDDIVVSGTARPSTDSRNLTADGLWYFNLMSVDKAGNWGAPTHFGPIRIDTTAPVTNDNVPVGGWVANSFGVVLTPGDSGSGVASTRYHVDSGSWLTGTSFTVSGGGPHTIYYDSIDAVGNREVTRSKSVLVDPVPPTVPADVQASPVDTSTADVTWTASTDASSGVAFYRVYVGGVPAGTSNSTTFQLTGLTAGETYVITVSAVDNAGNASSQSAPFSLVMPLATLWLDISAATVDFNSLQPGTPATLPGAETVSVNGIGALDYELTCDALDFRDTGAGTLTIPIGALSFVTHGQAEVGSRPFSETTVVIDSGTGSSALWRHDYTFDFTMDVPWDSDAVTYSTSIVYTAVAK
jgi:hypothetical protein